MPVNQEIYDLIVVGGGPSGLSAAITAESEGVNTLVLDASEQLGGQAGTSSLIENYAGFKAVTGAELTTRMVEQALGFETEFLLPVRVDNIEQTDDGLLVNSDGEAYLGRAAMVSSGVQYRTLRVPNLAAYMGQGVNYGSPRRSETFHSQNICVVGGANSAGQAAVHLASFDNCVVNLLVRSDDIREKMSEYLVRKIEKCGNIVVRTNTEVIRVDGDGELRTINVVSDGNEQTLPADRLFLLIGAEPKTHWLPDRVSRDVHGFVITGGDMSINSRDKFRDNSGREPFIHETGIPGLFAAGDVRCGTIKRVASAVGDGATVIPDVHRYLKTLQDA